MTWLFYCAGATTEPDILMSYKYVSLVMVFDFAGCTPGLPKNKYVSLVLIVKTLSFLFRIRRWLLTEAMVPIAVSEETICCLLGFVVVVEY